MNAFLEKYLHIFIYLFLLLLSIPLCLQDLYKGVFLLLIFTIWFVIPFFKKGYLYTLLFIFFLLPFNITLQIPESVTLLGNTLLLSQPYVAGLWVNYLVPTLSILDVFVLIFLLQLFVYRKRLFKRYISNKYILLLLFLLLIQSFIVQNFLTTLLSLRMFVYLFTTVVIVEIVKERSTLKKMLQKGYIKVLLISTVLFQATVGMYQFLRGSSLGVYFLGESKIANGMLGSSFIEIGGENFLRSYGTFPHPNILAGWYILILIFLIYMYSKTEEKIYLFTIPFLLFFSLFTFSRVSILLIVLICILYIFKYLKTSKKILSVPTLLWFRFVDIFREQDSSLVERIKLLKVNIGILKENLLLGTGVGNSIRHYSENIPLTEGGKLLLQPVHNIWVLMVVELGLLLGVYYLFLLYRFFIKGIKINTFTFSILLTVITVGMFDHYLFTLPQGNIIFFSFLILLSDSR